MQDKKIMKYWEALGSLDVSTNEIEKQLFLKVIYNLKSDLNGLMAC